MISIRWLLDRRHQDSEFWRGDFATRCYDRVDLACHASRLMCEGRPARSAPRQASGTHPRRGLGSGGGGDL